MSYSSSRRVAPRPEVMSEVRSNLSIPGQTSSMDKDICFDQRSVSSSKSRSQRKPSTLVVRGSYDRSQSFKNNVPSGSGSVSSGSSWKSGRSKASRNNQIVADFFDVQSFASDPAMLVGNRRSVGRHASAHNCETRSVTSKKSIGGNFMSFFLRMRNVLNDEVRFADDMEDNMSNCYGYDMPSVDDEELTLGSGLNSESGDTIYNDDQDDSTVVVKENISRMMRESTNGIEKKKKPSLISRILHRRRNHKEKQNAKKEAKLKDSESCAASSRAESEFNDSKSYNDARSVSSRSNAPARKVMPPSVASTATMTASYSTVSKECKMSVEKDTERSQSSKSSFSPTTDQANRVNERPELNKTPSCRWSCDLPDETSSSAPKPPVRRRDSGLIENPIHSSSQSESRTDLSRSISPSPVSKGQERSEADNSASKEITLDPKERQVGIEQDKAWRENVRREIAIRTGKDFSESKEEFDNYREDDDESVLSLLSGLLATWTAERDGPKSNENASCIPGSSPMYKPSKSILKTSDSCLDIRPRYSVVFDNIMIREYERTVGDNPSCSRGPPISIGWSYVLKHQYPIDDYELLIKSPKRSKKEFHLSADIRTQLLLEEWDCTEEDLRKARREVTYIQYRRAQASFSGVRSAEKEALFLKKNGAGSMPSGSPSSRNGGKPMNRRPGQSSAPRVPRRNNAGDCPPSVNSASSSSRHSAIMN